MSAHSCSPSCHFGCVGCGRSVQSANLQHTYEVSERSASHRAPRALPTIIVMRALQQRQQMDQTQAATVIQSGIRGRAVRRQAHKSSKHDALDGMDGMEETAIPSMHKVAEGEPVMTTVVVDRERICCDVLNTAIMAALVGGFALGNLSLSGTDAIDKWIYLLTCFSVHACTCSALTSAVLYREVVRMNDEAVPSWVAEKQLVLYLPVTKFFMGCTAYLGSVILISWRDLQEDIGFQIACLVIGIMSMSTIYVTLFLIYGPQKKLRQKQVRVVPHVENPP